MLLRIGNDGPQSVVVAEDAGVTHLTAAFAVERCLVGDDIHRVAHASAIDARAVPDDRDDLALTLFGGITDEFGAALFLDEIEPQFARRLVARSLPCRPRGSALLGHRGLDTLPIPLERPRTPRILGQTAGKAIGIVELERGFAGERLAGLQDRKSTRLNSSH